MATLQYAISKLKEELKELIQKYEYETTLKLDNISIDHIQSDIRGDYRIGKIVVYFSA